MVQTIGLRPRLGETLKELYRYRELVYALTVRDLKLKYKGSLIGVGWSLLNPVLQVAIYTLVFSVFLRIVMLPNYWAFVIGGILVWSFLAGCLQASATSFVRNSNLISKVYFPIEALTMSMILANFVNLLIPLAVLLAVLWLAGIPLGVSLILLPVLLSASLAMVIGWSLAIAAVTVHFRDIEHLLVLGLQVLFYLTPILYTAEAGALPPGSGRYIWLLQFNPLTWYLDSYHAVLYFGRWPQAEPLVLMMVFSILSLAAGWTLFVVLRPRLPEAV